MREQGIPGVAVGVVRHGRAVFLKGFGVATLEHAVPVRPETRFQIGSIGKQFTAVAVMLLAREGRLGLDDPLAKYLPEIPPAWDGVTLRRMLNHQAGIPQLTTPEHDLLDLHHDYTDEEYLRLASSLPLDFEPGTDVAYSDTAYVLLGFVIGRVAGEFYGDLLATRVFRPLRMERTRIVSDADVIPGRASGYQRDAAGRLRNQNYVAPALNRTADGSLYSTVVGSCLSPI
jgi:CubicO group peptidase (beta-lactamase class C family)